ncbi:MAG: glyoxalase family protein [Fimbriimonadaceae bacterium]|jgi:glyoxalase family protein|nr:glyoxalase family protein [Fimbriimonadaceae bacterium]
MATHSIHHVTAVTARIQDNLAFYTQTMGLRLVKRSVNQDDVSAYHLFYADKVGTPGTDMTFFDWPMIGHNSPGAGSVALTTFRVPGEALDWWEQRLTDAATHPERGEDDEGRPNLLFADFEGQRLELVDDTGLPGKAVPWTAVVPEENAIRGILGVTIESGRPDSTARVLSEFLDYQVDNNDGRAMVTSGDAYGRVRVLEPASSRFARLGAGGVHHVAFRVADETELLAKQAKIEAVGLQTSGLVDRYYFKSLYFREPGGVLFELATDGPGFASDEDPETLGERLALPPFLEPQRTKIEAGLRPLEPVQA